MNLDTAKFIGHNDEITHVEYYGRVDEFNEFCEVIRIKLHKLVGLRIKSPIDNIPIRLMHRLQYLDCSNTLVTKLDYGPDLHTLIASNTDIKIEDVFHSIKKINYLKLGSIEKGTRVTIDSNTEYTEWINKHPLIISSPR